jgi:hypothetical protein
VGLLLTLQATPMLIATLHLPPTWSQPQSLGCMSVTQFAKRDDHELRGEMWRFHGKTFESALDAKTLRHCEMAVATTACQHRSFAAAVGHVP